MGVTLQWDGMAEYLDALRKLPETLADEAGDVVQAAASGAKATVEADYPRRTGNLQDHVTVKIDRSRAGVVATVRSGSPHASLFEKGTVTRRTAQGWNRGAMPRPPASERAIPVFARARERMLQGLIAILQRNGFQVDQ